jgi:hypothetical protein
MILLLTQVFFEFRHFLFHKVVAFNAESEATELQDEVSHNQWTDISESPSFIIGEQVRFNNERWSSELPVYTRR